MTSAPLEQLYRQFLATGDEAALEQWMRRSRPTLRRLALRLGASDDDADDLVQETFVAAIQGAERYDHERPLLPWLKGILTFRAARLARDEVRRREHYLASQELRSAAEPTHCPYAAELDADVRDAIDDLPMRYREPLAQYLLAQRSPVEIAERLGLERATVRTQLHRGLQRLRDALRRWALLALLVLFGRPARAAVSTALLLLGAWFLATPPPPEEHPGFTHVVAAKAGSASTQRGTRETSGAWHRLLASATPMPLVIRVHDRDGRPVPGVGVAVEPALGRDPVLCRRTAVTDAHGCASFATVTTGALLVTTDRGHRRTLDHADGDATRATFTLDTGLEVRGRCLDPHGAPVSGASVWLAHDPGGAWRGQDVATTDGDGRFCLLGVAPGSFVAARHHRWTRSTPVATDDEDVELRLGPTGARAHVQVVNTLGRPIADARVFVGDAMDAQPLHLAQQAAPRRAPPCVARSDRAGGVQTHALRIGAHAVAVRAAGYAPHRGVLELLGVGDGHHTVVLQASRTIRGRVVDEQGSPVPHAFAVFRHDDPSAFVDVHTDETGGFVLGCVPLAGGEILARAPGFAAGCVHLREHADGAPLRVVVPRQRTLRGQLQFESGRGCGAEVRAAWPPSALRAPRIVVRTDPNGRFALPAEGPGAPQLAVRLPGEPLFRDIDAYASWRPQHVSVTLPNGFSASSHIEGSCRSDDGTPIAGARIFLQHAGRWHEAGATDASGSYRIGPLPAGGYRVFAESRAPGLPSVHGCTFQLPAGTRHAEPLVAAATGTLRVTLVRDDGGPIPDALMTVQHRDLHRRFAIANGSTLEQRLVAGSYEVSVMGSRIAWIDAHPVQVRAGERTEARIVVRAAHRCTLVPTGLPPRAAGQAVRFVLRSTEHPNDVRSFDLLPDAPLRLGAVLPPGDYLLEHEAGGATFVGAFAVVGVRDTAGPCYVAMQQRD